MIGFKSINLKGELLTFEHPRIMGILNITPDSFYAGSRVSDIDNLLIQVEKMLNEGADILDMGAVSTRPGSDFISEEEEKKRLLPALEIVLKHFPKAKISIDTYRASVAREAIQLGAALINDISGGIADAEMIHTVAGLQVPYVVMHMRGTPQTMTLQNVYQAFPQDVYFELAQQVETCKRAGVHDIIIDPGFGFAKNIQQNFELFRSLHPSFFENNPLMIGISRKSMIYKTLNTTPEQALNGTTALHMSALQKGADILRGHDVKAAAECIKLYQELKS
ncbi:MAG: dihydropteroate synthase [Flavobacteriales bacterium]|nr:dihydropteroate synthase [Flavobacteriales bacterium]